MTTSCLSGIFSISYTFFLSDLFVRDGLLLWFEFMSILYFRCLLYVCLSINSLILEYQWERNRLNQVIYENYIKFFNQNDIEVFWNYRSIFSIEKKAILHWNYFVYFALSMNLFNICHLYIINRYHIRTFLFSLFWKIAKICW